MRVLNNIFNQEINGMDSVTPLVLLNLSGSITDANSSIQTSIDILTDTTAVIRTVRQEATMTGYLQLVF